MKRFLLGLGLSSFLFSGFAYSAVRIDMIPDSVLVKKTLRDDVNNRYDQSVFIYVKNVGNRPLKVTRAIDVTINGSRLRGYLYGPDNRGGSIYGPVNPGEKGKIVIYRPVGTYRHCQVLDVHIDTSRRAQATTDGSDVFRNDRKRVKAKKYGSRRLCLKLPIPIPKFPHFPRRFP